MRDAGFSSGDLSWDDFEVARTIAIMNAIVQYDKDPSGFCSDARLTFGPGGTYRRQMLELN